MKNVKVILPFVFSLLLILAILVLVSKNASNKNPDVVRTICINKHMYLTVIANRDKIENEIEFVTQIIDMYKENSFKSVRFSTDSGYATALDIQVYHWKEDIESGSLVMTIRFEPIEYGRGYDIINHPDKFNFYLNDMLIQ